VSPILVRPVREQFEHDRVIRVLQARYKRKFEVAINPGPEQNASVEVGAIAMYPDLLLFSQERGRKLQGTIEVETVESINTLEAMAEWAPLGRLRAPFYLYVPPNTVDTVRRLCAAHEVAAAEIWTYHMAVDQIRFTMVHRSADAPVPANSRPAPKPEKKTAARPVKAAKKTAPAKPAPRTAKSKPRAASSSMKKTTGRKPAKPAKRR
jgi:hypothetical protein